VSDNNYIEIHTVAKTKIVSSRNIGYYEECWRRRAFSGFIPALLMSKRCVNTPGGKTGYVELEDGTRLEVAKRKREDFMKLIELM
jgi:hypothetical protein